MKGKGDFEEYRSLLLHATLRSLALATGLSPLPNSESAVHFAHPKAFGTNVRCHRPVRRKAAITKGSDIKKILLDIAKGGKTHVGEFLTLLLSKDGQQTGELEKGKKEVEELTGK